MIYKNIRQWLLNSNYPVYMVATMTEEEAVTGNVSVPQPVGGSGQ